MSILLKLLIIYLSCLETFSYNNNIRGCVQASECSRRKPGNFAIDSNCQCVGISCPSTNSDGLPMDFIRSMGKLICDISPFSCRHNEPCPSSSMIREPHTCNCLKIAYPCLPNQVLSGNRGGPYTCMSFGL